MEDIVHQGAGGGPGTGVNRFLFARFFPEMNA